MMHKLRDEHLMAGPLGVLPCALSLVRVTWVEYPKTLGGMQVLKLRSIGWRMADEAAGQPEH